MVRHVDIREPLDALVRFGGLKVAAMMGAVLEAAQRYMVILANGLTVMVVVLMAAHVASDVLRFCVLGHMSGGRGHCVLLELLDMWPLPSLLLRLGEGSGAVLAYSMAVLVVVFLCEMATLASAGVSERASP